MYFFALGQLSRADRRENLHDGMCPGRGFLYFRWQYLWGSGSKNGTFAQFIFGVSSSLCVVKTTSEARRTPGRIIRFHISPFPYYSAVLHKTWHTLLGCKKEELIMFDVFIVYCRRSQRIVTTASAEVINLSVAHGGVTTLITATAFVTVLMSAEKREGTVIMTS